MECIELNLPGLKKLKPKVYADSRGFFMESFNSDQFAKFGIKTSFPQDNHSFSQKGCIRGFHFQTLPGQAKLVRAAHGKIFDVAIDIRPSSPTFGQWEGVILDGEAHEQLFIPIGFAHGFCVLSENAHVIYKVSSLYNPATEKGFQWNDPDVGVKWPVETPILSDRDKSSPTLKEIVPELRGLPW